MIMPVTLRRTLERMNERAGSHPPIVHHVFPPSRHFDGVQSGLPIRPRPRPEVSRFGRPLVL